MAKAAKETFFLVSSEGTGFFYSNRKNKKKGKRGDMSAPAGACRVFV